MWLDDPEVVARHRAGAPHRVAYRVAGWSRIDLASLSAIAVWWSVIYVGLGLGPRAISLFEVGIVSTVTVAPFVMLAARFADLVRVDEHGIQGVRARGSNHTRSARIPLDAIGGIEVRDWYQGYDADTGEPISRRTWARRQPRAICVRLTDGRYVEVFARGRDWWRPVLVERRRWRWRPARNADGRWLIWRPEADAEVAAMLQRRVDEMRAALAGLPTPPLVGDRVQVSVDGFRVDVHRRQPPTRAKFRKAYSVAVDGDDAPVPPPAPEPLPPRPPAPPTLGDRTVAGAATASARIAVLESDSDSQSSAAIPRADLEVPARYWTLASVKAGSVLGRRSSMVIDGAGVSFQRRLRSDLHVPLASVDRFDIDFHAFPDGSELEPTATLTGNWRLLLFLTDGTRLPLSGLNHGFYKANELYWAVPPDAPDLHPAGSMPWPNDQPLLVAARLNAHVAAMRAAGAGPVAPSAAPG